MDQLPVLYLIMPVDISFCRSADEGGIVDEVRRWQLARCCSFQNERNLVEDQVEDFFTKIQIVDMERRKTLRNYNERRARLNTLQKTLAPKKKKDGQHHEDINVDKEMIREEIKSLKLETLPSLSNKLDLQSRTLQEELYKIGNVVDDEDFTLDGLDSVQMNEKRGVMTGRDDEFCFFDPLFCIGGYEKLEYPAGTKQSVTKSKRIKYLTGLGSDIASSLLSYGKEFFRNHERLGMEVKMMHAPESILLPNEMAHETMGCTATCELNGEGSLCNICTNDSDQIEVPSFVALASMHQSKSYSERMLPQVYISSTQCLNQADKSNEQISQFSHPIERLQIFAISTSNLTISRSLCDEFAQAIKDMYISLLSSSHTKSDNKAKILSFTKEQLLRVRTLQPSLLEKNEARKILVEGYMPSMKKYIVLGHVSNSTDFISRAFKIKCGGSKLQGQGVEYTHLIHGAICDGFVAMNWVLENNISTLTNSGDDRAERNVGVAIPPCLVSFLYWQRRNVTYSTMWIPFIRKLVKGKNGKNSVKRIEPMIDILFIDHKVGPTLIQHNRTRTQEMKSSVEKKVQIKAKSSSCPRNLSLKDINAEANCNPYDFLPFYK